MLLTRLPKNLFWVGHWSGSLQRSRLAGKCNTNPKNKASTIQTLSTLHPNSAKFVVLLVAFDIMLGRHICLIQSCDIVIRKYFLTFHNEY